MAENSRYYEIVKQHDYKNMTIEQLKRLISRWFEIYSSDIEHIITLAFFEKLLDVKIKEAKN